MIPVLDEKGNIIDHVHIGRNGILKFARRIRDQMFGFRNISGAVYLGGLTPYPTATDHQISWETAFEPRVKPQEDTRVWQINHYEDNDDDDYNIENKFYMVMSDEEIEKLLEADAAELAAANAE